MIGEPIPHALKQAIHAEQIQWGGQPIKSARAIDFYLFYHIHEQNAFIVGKEESLPMHLSTKHFLSAQRDLPFPTKGTFQHTGHKKRLAFASLFRPKSIRLLGVQFDDVGFVDFVLVWEFVSLRETNQGSSPVIERFFDVWKIEGLSFLEGLFEHFVGSVSFTQGNDLASAQRVGWNVYSLAIDIDEAMGNHLTSLTDGTCKASTIYDVIESGFQQEQQVFAYDAGHSLCFIIIAVELLFKQVVHCFNFLFFCELDAVFRHFLLTSFRWLPF